MINQVLFDAIQSPYLNALARSWQSFCGVKKGKPTNFLLFYFFTLCTYTGSEEMYGLMLPILMWFTGGSVARMTVVGWIMFFGGFWNSIFWFDQFFHRLFSIGGQYLKDIFCLPRPSKSKVAVLNQTFSQGLSKWCEKSVFYHFEFLVFRVWIPLYPHHVRYDRFLLW